MTRPPAPVLVLVPALVLLGISAEWVLYGPDAPRIGSRDDLSLALMDLLTGWTVAATGLVAWARRPASRIGPLLVASGAAWFLYNFHVADAAVLAALAVWLEQLYRAPLLHAVLTFPSGRVTTPAGWAAVAVAWGVSLVPALWGDPMVSLALGLGLVAWCWLGYRAHTGEPGAHRASDWWPVRRWASRSRSQRSGWRSAEGRSMRVARLSTRPRTSPAQRCSRRHCCAGTACRRA